MKSNFTHLKAWTATVAVMAVVSFAHTAQSQRTQRPSQRLPQRAVNSADVKPFEYISDRNIFDPNRRGPRREITNAPVTIVDSFALTGTMNYPKGIFAFFDGTRSDFNHVLEKGGKIAGYTVAEVGHDVVKLTQDTNVLELKVGMQMRRSADGKWAVTEATTANIGFSSMANAARYNGGRQERRMMPNRNGGRPDFGNFTMPMGGGLGMPAGGEAPQMNTAPAEAGNLDPSDPVARLMLRRMQETGGVPPPTETTTEEPANPNEPANVQNEPVPTNEAPNAPETRPADGTDNPNQANEN